MAGRGKALYWILTIPHHQFTPYLPPSVQYVRGQLERGEDTGYLHWQVLVVFKGQVRMQQLKEVFGGSVHAEPSRSDAADKYVWKDDTAVPGTRFELGDRKFRRSNATDWAAVLRSSKEGRFEDIPPDILLRHYGNIKKVYVDNVKPIGIERVCKVYWGPTGTGKSRAAWAEAGGNAFPKDPCTKFWDGYRGQKHVVIDEFRGTIGISHMLRWLDRYPVIIEIKGSSTVLEASAFWITSNLSPDAWYPDADMETKAALRRRLEVRQFVCLAPPG